jgi:hypothetical protein
MFFQSKNFECMNIFLHEKYIGNFSSNFTKIHVEICRVRFLCASFRSRYVFSITFDDRKNKYHPPKKKIQIVLPLHENKVFTLMAGIIVQNYLMSTKGQTSLLLFGLFLPIKKSNRNINSCL